MLTYIVDEIKYWDEKNEEIITIPQTIYYLEHSLVSLSNWESKWRRSLLKIIDPDYELPYTNEELSCMLIDYFKYMIIDCEGDKNTIDIIPVEYIDFNKILKYINDTPYATVINNNNPTQFEEDNQPKKKKQILTAEYIYGLMINLRIPIQMETWHLNRLLTLISVINVQQNPDEKVNKKDAIRSYAKINKARAKRRAKRR